MVFCKRNRKATEQAILLAAAKLFAEKGFENTRTLEIAKEAKANEALIGRYFGGKEGLLTAVLQDEGASRSLIQSKTAGCSVDELPKKEPGRNFREALQIYFKQGEQEAKQKEQFMRIAMSRSLIDREMAKLVQEKIIDAQMPTLEQSLGAYLEDSNLTKKETEALAMLIAASSHTFNFLGRRIHEMDDKKINLALSLLIDSIEAYLEKRA